MIACVSELTTMSATFDEDVRAFANAACPTMEVWLTKLEQFIASRSIEAARELASEYEVCLAVAAAKGGILVGQGDQRREAFELFERRLEICHALNIRTLIVIADFHQFAITEYERAVVSLKQAARMAADRAVRLALEFQARNTFCNNLHTALEFVNEVADPNVGICFDVFHYYTGPSKLEDLSQLSANNLFHVQLSDLAGIPRELASDVNRILPGDGDFQLQPIIDRCRSIGYEGCVSVELMNPQIWQVPAAQVVEISVTALRRLIAVN